MNTPVKVASVNSKAGTLIVAAGGLAAAGLLIVIAPALIALVGMGEMGASAGEALFTLAIFGPLLALAVVCGGLTGCAPFHLGSRPAARAVQGAAIGLGGLLLAVGYAVVAGTLMHGNGAHWSVASLTLGALLVLIQVGAEEAFFRGWLQPLIASAWSLSLTVPAVAMSFAVLHFVGGVRGPIELANLFLGGLLFGLLTVRGKGIAGAIGAHLTWNSVEQLGLGLDPNPGTGTFGTLLDYDLVGKSMWGGSDAGLNASVAMTISLLALLVPLALMASKSVHLAFNDSVGSRRL
jgi:hypothetical protein